LEKIAWEKAGIIKAGSPVVSGASGAAADVIGKQAHELGVSLTDTAKIKYDITARTPDGYTFDVDMGGRRYDGMELSMVGEHQVQNAVTALCALGLLTASGTIKEDEEALRRGMKAVCLEARFHVVQEKPLVVFDGAHNPDGARALAKTLRELLPDGRILFVCSIMRDKEAGEMLAAFAAVAADFVVTASTNERSLTASELAGLVKDAGGSVTAEATTPNEAYNTAMSLAGEYDAVVFAGSLYLIGDIVQLGKEAEGQA